MRTDNRALNWIRSLESPTGMILRWLEILASFDFTVKHRKDTLHGNADSLSRVPHTALPSHPEEKILVSDEAAVVAALQAPPGFTTEEIREHQEGDEYLRDVLRWKAEPPSEADKQLLSPDQRRLLAFLPSLHQDPSSGLWSLRSQEDETPCDRLYVPHALRHRIIEATRVLQDTLKNVSRYRYDTFRKKVSRYKIQDTFSNVSRYKIQDTFEYLYYSLKRSNPS